MKKLLMILLFLVTAICSFSETITHIVTEGDTLYGVAKKYSTTTENILLENNLDTESLYINQKLIITTLRPDQYKVKSGDSLSSIAFDHDITLKHLLLANRIKEDQHIQIGELLLIPIDASIKKEYEVQKGDTLSWISMVYDIEIEEITKLNNIKNNNLVIGKTLTLVDTSPNQVVEVKQASIAIPLINMKSTKDNSIKYTIEKLDTLSAIALEYQTSIEDIKKINKFTDDKISIGQEIRLPSYAKKREPIDYNFYHTVQKGDTLSAISLDYDISETLLMELNNFSDDKISIGQKIKLIPPETRSHKVAKGETLWSIARLYNVSVDQLMQYNHLNSTLVKEGKLLSIYDYQVAKHIIDQKQEDSINLVSLKYSHNTSDSQPYKNYSLDQLINPLEKYNKAKENWNKFSELIAKEDLISNDLEGWTVILDPGHGGKDPGAIASVVQNGKTSFIVEDEYAYDTAVRLYELLKRNGAKAYMTILSPDHIARNPSSNTTTFINEKNEVYNNYNLNKINNSSVWPVGGQWGLSQRVLISNNILSSVESEKTLFISIHADNDVDRGTGKLILYSDRYGTIDSTSKEFAQNMTTEMGDTTVKGMTLAVLNKNNADYKMLIELRNMAHISEAMALLDNETRQNDALMILNGIKRATLFSK